MRITIPTLELQAAVFGLHSAHVSSDETEYANAFNFFEPTSLL